MSKSKVKGEFYPCSRIGLIRLLLSPVFLSLIMLGIADANSASTKKQKFLGGLQLATGPNIAGTWIGQCDDCAATKFTMKLRQTGENLKGTIQIDGTNTFGDSEKALEKVEITNGKIQFTVYGGSGDAFDVELKVRSDGQVLVGDGYYGGGNFGLTFERK